MATEIFMTPIYAALRAERTQTADYLTAVLEKLLGPGAQQRTPQQIHDYLLGTLADVREGRHVQDCDHLREVAAAYQTA